MPVADPTGSVGGGRQLTARFAFAGAAEELARTLPLADDETVLFHGAMRLRRAGSLPRPVLLRLTKPRLVLLAHYAFRPDRVWELPRAAVQAIDLVGNAVQLTWIDGEGGRGLLRLGAWSGRAALDRALRDPAEVAAAVTAWRWPTDGGPSSS